MSFDLNSCQHLSSSNNLQTTPQNTTTSTSTSTSTSTFPSNTTSPTQIASSPSISYSINDDPHVAQSLYSEYSESEFEHIPDECNDGLNPALRSAGIDVYSSHGFSSSNHYLDREALLRLQELGDQDQPDPWNLDDLLAAANFISNYGFYHHNNGNSSNDHNHNTNGVLNRRDAYLAAVADATRVADDSATDDDDSLPPIESLALSRQDAITPILGRPISAHFASQASSDWDRVSQQITMQMSNLS